MNKLKPIKELSHEKRIYKFGDKHLALKLPELKIVGKDTSKKRFILVYSNEEEKEFFMKLLGIAGKKVIYSLKDFYK